MSRTFKYVAILGICCVLISVIVLTSSMSSEVAASASTPGLAASIARIKHNLIDASVSAGDHTCCLTWANAKMWVDKGYYSDVEDTEDLIYDTCEGLGDRCQWQSGVYCPSSFGVHLVAQELDLPGYCFPDEWSLPAFFNGVCEEALIAYWWNGPGHEHPPGESHAYYCNDADLVTELKDGIERTNYKLWCYDVLNQNGKWWTTDAQDWILDPDFPESTENGHWSGWSNFWLGTWGGWYLKYTCDEINEEQIWGCPLGDD